MLQVLHNALRRQQPTVPALLGARRHIYSGGGRKKAERRLLPRPKTMIGVAVLVSLAAMFNAVLQRELDKVRMYRGVTLDVERMKQKRPQGLGIKVEDVE
mmetsp:Transcript_42301/g.76702  ORF Transcript_42301/g.76702 Transcript_42301/m.76702 type:complete len:100 (-) Transcript_42301:115-414(-)